jgi:hypothetical protein
MTNGGAMVLSRTLLLWLRSLAYSLVEFPFVIRNLAFHPSWFSPVKLRRRRLKTA